MLSLLKRSVFTQQYQGQGAGIRCLLGSTSSFSNSAVVVSSSNCRPSSQWECKYKSQSSFSSLDARSLHVLPLCKPGQLNFSSRSISQVRFFRTGAACGTGREVGGGSGSSDGEKVWRLPLLSDFPFVIWPRFTHTVRNWFLTYFVIKPYFDKDFSMQEFMHGAHEAVALVSSKMSSGEIDDLEGLVEPVVLSELRQSISKFSVAQQDLLRVATEDIFFSFPYQVGVIIPDPPPGSESGKPDMTKIPQTRHVEITVVLHVLRGMAETQKKSESTSFSIADFTKDENNRYRVMVCNYRFFRDFTEGCKDPSWIINMVNHFLPAEVVPQR